MVKQEELFLLSIGIYEFLFLNELRGVIKVLTAKKIGASGFWSFCYKPQ